MRALLDIPVDAGALEAALEGLVCLDVWVLEQRELPGIYESGVRYQREPRRRRGQPEHWLRVDEVLERGHGDCEDLVAARVAELRVDGDESARGIVVPDPGRPSGFHALVEHGDGMREDPSSELGMNGGPP